MNAIEQFRYNALKLKIEELERQLNKSGEELHRMFKKNCDLQHTVNQLRENYAKTGKTRTTRHEPKEMKFMRGWYPASYASDADRFANELYLSNQRELAPIPTPK